MNSNSNLSSFFFKPTDNYSKTVPVQNWINSPKANQTIRFRCQQYESSETKMMRVTHKEQLSKQQASLKPNKNKTSHEFNNVLASFNYQPENKRNESYSMAPQNYQSKNEKMNKNFIALQNVPPNTTQYNQMHYKLNLIEDKLTKMKQQFQRKKQERKNQTMEDLTKIMQLQRRQQEKKIDNNGNALKQIVSQVNCQKNLKSINFDPYTSTKHNIYYVSEVARTFKQENSLARNHLITSLQQLKALKKVKGHKKQQLDFKLVKLIRKNIYQGRKTVIFDLDQTLIHCNQNSSTPCDVKLKIKFPTGQIIEAGINVRPYAIQILKQLSRNFQVIVFTASHSCYANVVLDYLDPENQYISHRLFRQHCYQTPEGVYIKDLRIINRQLSQTILIDNAAYSYCLQIENGIPIIPFYQGKVDFELKALQGYIQSLMFCKDVRDMNRNTFKLNRYIQFEEAENLVSNLYGDSLL